MPSASFQDFWIRQPIRAMIANDNDQRREPQQPVDHAIKQVLERIGNRVER
jgi:hypothetical protein